MTRIYMLSGVVAAFLALLAALGWGWAQNKALRAQNAALVASTVVLKLESELSREGQLVANARADWFAAKAKEYDDLREGILRDGEDADLPIWLRNVLVGLQPRPNNQVD